MELTKSNKVTDTKVLYQTAFPPEERLPWWILRLMTAIKGVELTAYYNDQEYIGFTHTTVSNHILFVMFLAVQGERRGKGWGSSILDNLKNSHPGKTIILNVEPPDESAANAAERIKRMHFYEQNGFFNTGYNIAEVGGIFRVLSTDPILDAEAYLQVFRKLSLGFWRPEISIAE